MNAPPHPDDNITEEAPISDTPKVSIGLAVYNGEKYLEQAIDSILAQTFTDFELIISDNASTDRTAEICQKYAARDGRIRYSRNPANIGGANNENLTFRLARGPYFRWAAHDDVLAPTLLEECVRVLDENPDLALCYSMIVEIDEHGRPGATVSRRNAASRWPFVRFAKIASSHDFLEETYGVMRSEVLRKTRLQQPYTASDRTLMCELALHGRFYEVPKPLFYKRFHPGNTYIDWRSRMAWFDSKYIGKIVFPFWMQFIDYFVTIGRAPVSALTRLLCTLYMLGPWLAIYGQKMIKDVLIALMMLLHTPEWRRKHYENTANWS